MAEIIIAFAKYSVLFICGFYGYLKLAKIKLKLINLLDDKGNNHCKYRYSAGNNA